MIFTVYTYFTENIQFAGYPLISGDIHCKIIDPYFTVKAFCLQCNSLISGNIHHKGIDLHFTVKTFSLQCIPGDIYQKR